MHLVLEFSGRTQEVAKALCGQTAATEDSSHINFETTPIYEIIRAAAKDDKNKICNKCLAEFFDKVLPLSWELMKKEEAATPEKRRTAAAKKWKKEGEKK
jgi:hypothetical protein